MKAHHSALADIKNCYYCGVETVIVDPKKRAKDFPANRRTIDHKVPTSRGGINHISNYAIACYRCNLDKHHLTEEEYRLVLAYRNGVEPKFSNPIQYPRPCSLRKHLMWLVAPYVNNFIMALVSASVFFLVHLRKHF